MPPNRVPTRAESQRSLPLISIAVMGATGSGKSSFINIASGSQLRVGVGLASCTTEVQLSNEFIIDGRRVILIDTPGFDDTSVSDAEILNRIAVFLAATYENGSKLSGIIYLQRICDDRFTGISVRNFRMFRMLCGDSTLKNVVLVTNMWGKVTQDVGGARERELSSNFFKAALDKGAQLARHQNTVQSSHDIIRRIMRNNPTAFRIQRELVDEGRNITDTSAGEVVSEEINELIKRHKAEMRVLREELRNALENRDEGARAELEEATSGLRREIQRLKTESETMTARYEEERQRVEQVMEQMQIQENPRQEVRNLSEGDRGFFDKLVRATLQWRVVQTILHAILQFRRRIVQTIVQAVARRQRRVDQTAPQSPV